MQKLFLKEERPEHRDMVPSPILNQTGFAEAASAPPLSIAVKWVEVVLEVEMRHLQVKPLNLTAQSWYLIAPEEKSPWGRVNNQYQILFFFTLIFFKSFMLKQCGDQYLMKLYAVQDGLWADTFIKIPKWESTRT